MNDIYVSEKESFVVSLPNYKNIFIELDKYYYEKQINYQFINTDPQYVNYNWGGRYVKDSWATSQPQKYISSFRGDMFRRFATQLNFAVYCVGIDYRKEKNPLIRSILEFHFYYTVKRVLKILEIPLPGDNAFKSGDNYYLKDKLELVRNMYDVRENIGRFQNISPDATNSHYNNNNNWKTWFVERKNHKQFYTRLDESICNYVYLIMSAQIGARMTITSGPSSQPAIAVFKTKLSSLVNQRDSSIEQTVANYQNVLSKCRVDPNYVVYPGCYLIPSEIVLSLKPRVGYNDKLMKASLNSKVGEIPKEPVVHKVPKVHIVAKKPEVHTVPKVPVVPKHEEYSSPIIHLEKEPDNSSNISIPLVILISISISGAIIYFVR